MKEVVFYYDVVCPFAFMASKLIEGVARRTGAKIRWKPVLLGKVCNTDRMNVDKGNLICLRGWRNTIADTSNLLKKRICYSKTLTKN